MKKLTFILLFFFSFIFVQSQVCTIKDYNYITKGYDYETELGLNHSSDYKIDSLLYYSTGEHEGFGFYIQKVFKKSYSLTCPIAYRISLDMGEGVFCLPHPLSDSSVKQAFTSSYSENFKGSISYSCTLSSGTKSFNVSEYLFPILVILQSQWCNL